MFIAAVKQVNRVILDAQEEAVVWIVHRFTNKDGEVERLVRFEMDAVREFALRHPLQCWNPLFILNTSLGRELMDDIATARQQFFMVDDGPRPDEFDPFVHEVDMDATLAFRKKFVQAKRNDVILTANDVDALSKKIRAYRARNGMATGQFDLTEAIESMPAKDFNRLGFTS